MWWAMAIGAAYLVLLLTGMLFLRTAAKAEKRISSLEGYPKCPDQPSQPAPEKPEGEATLRKASGA